MVHSQSVLNHPVDTISSQFTKDINSLSSQYLFNLIKLYQRCLYRKFTKLNSHQYREKCSLKYTNDIYGHSTIPCTKKFGDMGTVQ